MVTLSTQSTKYVDLALARANNACTQERQSGGRRGCDLRKKHQGCEANRGPLDGST